MTPTPGMPPLEELVASVLDVPAGEVGPSTSRDSLDAWDSLGHIGVIAAVEEVYRIALSAAETRSIRSIADLRRVLGSKGVVV